MTDSDGSTWTNRCARARQAAGSGKAVIGYVGGPFPLALAEALGVIAISLDDCPYRESPVLDAFIDEKEDPRISAVFAAAIDGELAYLSGIVTTRRYEFLHYYLREMLRAGRAAQLPALHLFDLIPIESQATTDYDAGTIERLAVFLARLSGRSPSFPDDLADLLVRRQRALGQLVAAQNDGTVSGTASAATRLEGMSLETDAFEGTVARTLKQAEASPDARRLLLLSSEPFANACLHARIEDSGRWRIAADDDGSGQIAPFTGIVAHPRSYADLAGLYANQLPSALAHPRALRHGSTLDLIEASAFDGALVVVDPADNRLGWDYPALRDHLHAAGAACVLLRARLDAPDFDAKLDGALAKLAEAGERVNAA